MTQDAAPLPFAARLQQLEAKTKQLLHDTNIIDGAIADIQLKIDELAGLLALQQGRLHALEEALLAARDTMKAAAEAIAALQAANDTISRAVADHCRRWIQLDQWQQEREPDDK